MEAWWRVRRGQTWLCALPLALKAFLHATLSVELALARILGTGSLGVSGQKQNR